MATDPEFTWRDGERTIALRRRGLARAAEILPKLGLAGDYTLLSTERALAGAPAELAGAAGEVLEVPPGQVPDTAAALLGAVGSEQLVALGGGRVIDTAKAIGAVRGGAVLAIPTTLSGAEMTAVHRLPPGAEGAELIRPAAVLADPALMSSAAEDALRASALNALAHAAEALYGPGANPISELAALRAAALLADALSHGRDGRDRPALATGSLLGAYALDSAGYSFHHALCQTVVRIGGVSHAGTYAALLPVTMSWLEPRAPALIGALAEAIGAGAGAIAARIRELGGDPPGLGELGLDRGDLPAIVEVAAARPQVRSAPGGPPSEPELAAMLDAAW